MTVILPIVVIRILTARMVRRDADAAAGKAPDPGRPSLSGVGRISSRTSQSISQEGMSFC